MQATGLPRIVRPPRPPRPVKPSTSSAHAPAPPMALPRPPTPAPRPPDVDPMSTLSQLEQRRETSTIEYDDEGRRIMTEPLASPPRPATTILHPPGSGNTAPARPVLPPVRAHFVLGARRPPVPPAPRHLTTEQKAAWYAD